MRWLAILLVGIVVGGSAEARPFVHMLPANVTFDGQLENPRTPRGRIQWAMIRLAGIWANCNVDALSSVVTEDVDFSYPTTRYEGIEALRADILAFCGPGGSGTETSLYFPEDAFYIDVRNNRVAAEVQFRSTVRGAPQVVNDVWIGTVENGRLSTVKEYLDGRVKDLQTLGVLTFDTDAPSLAPWPPRTPAWEACFPIVRAAPINTCPPTP